jgi:hypothetical protein
MPTGDEMGRLVRRSGDGVRGTKIQSVCLKVEARSRSVIQG